ncbi:MAG: ribosomal protein S18-alanine N-acetyltransferase [Elusimicrobia bacterium]|nr:ribosomal protein S18-alanine N-acetyltransferase [Elusimicrobiota bacterium]
MNARPARPADLPELLAIERSCPAAPQWSESSLAAGLGSARSRLLVLEDAGRVQGFAALLVVPPEAELTSIVIRPEAQGRGLGRDLLAGAAAEARSSGCSKLSLEVSAANGRALGFYEAAGFKAVGRRPKYYGDGSDAVLMDLGLS